MYSELLKKHGRLDIPITATSQSAFPNISSSKVYEQKHFHTCSLALADGMCSASYHSPRALQMVGVAWTCLDCVDGEIAMVRKAWLSLLCPVQYLMIDKHAKHELGGLVLGATSCGVMVWKLEKAHLWTSSALVVTRSAWQGIDGLTLVLEAHSTT